MTIITDTREQLPYWIVKRVKLDVGDYTTTKLLNKFHIERKSLQDLYGTLTGGNNRFKRELFRAAYHQVRLEVFVEGTYEDFINKKFPRGDERKYSTDGLIELVKTFKKVYYLHFEWHKNRRECLKNVENRLKQKEKELKK